MGELFHYGADVYETSVPGGPGSGRYPRGSGENPYQHESSFLAAISDLERRGLKTEKDFCEYFGMSSTEFRKRKTYEVGLQKAANRASAIELYNQGYNKTQIGEMLGISDKTAGNYIRFAEQTKSEQTLGIADELKRELEQHKFLDVGEGTEAFLNVSKERLASAVQKLQDEGYTVEEIYIKQATDPSKSTTMKILAPPGYTQADILKEKDDITFIGDAYSRDGGKTFLGIEPPSNLDSKRLAVRYAEDGGKDMDGVIEIRPGVEDISLGGAAYAQVRIAVDGTHYLKGMAMYSDDLPPGVDVRFNTNKTSDVPIMGPKNNTVLKPLKKDNNGNVDQDNPFGTVLRIKDGKIVGQRHYTDEDGNDKLSPVNIVRQEGDWNEWSRTLASQFLSKQPLQLIDKQLKKTLDDRKMEYDDILKIAQPEARKQLLTEFAENCDKTASELKVAALPRQASKVILPLTQLNENEVYAPTFRNGETVALVRYPHAGTFEIPMLTVNNKNPQGKSLLGQAIDAIGINPKVAQQLSGADFDGDSVVVLPTNGYKIQAKSPLKGLADFDPAMYKTDKDIKINKQTEMGKISNLITDMTLKGADEPELVRAVKHSMVVIDAEKHRYDYKLSEKDNGIAELKKKYQDGGGASTLISLAGKEYAVDDRRVININKDTGEKIYLYSGKTKEVPKKKDEKGNVTEWKTVDKKTKSTYMNETNDAFTLSSGTKVENRYASFANSLKALANSARKESVSTPSTKKDNNAAKIYEKEVKSMESKLNLSLQNKPRERKAQIMANTIINQRIKANPDMTYEEKKDLRKKVSTLTIASERANAKSVKNKYSLTDKEWEALNAGALSSSKASSVIKYMDKDALKKYAIPKNPTTVSSSKIARIKSLSKNEYTLAEIADSVGLSVTTVSNILSGKEGL